MNASKKTCPNCRQENEDNVSFCVHCGAQLDEGSSTGTLLPTENQGAQGDVKTRPSLIDVALIPAGGLGIHIAGEFKPIYMQMSEELILGRLNDPSEAGFEAILDLSKYNAAILGISRRHLMIQRKGTGFQVIDLTSRNGTWLNDERLLPNKPYPLTSGSLLRIGQMQLLIMYRPVHKNT